MLPSTDLPGGRRRCRRALAGALPAALAALALLPAAASADEALLTWAGFDIRLRHPAEGALTSVHVSGDQLVFSSTTLIRRASGASDCNEGGAVSARVVTCQLDTSRLASYRFLFTGQDAVDNFAISIGGEAIRSITLEGGGGADVLSGSGLIGSPTQAPIRFDGGEGDDLLLGGFGDDLFDDGPGGDRVVGGRGFDTLSYLGASAGVAVTQDGIANDGRPGEGDDVDQTVEKLVLTELSDLFAAGPGAVDNVVEARGGADLIATGAGNDTITTTGPSGDRVDAGDGDDTVTTAGGADAIDAGPGHDQVAAGGGADVVEGGSGDDRLDAGSGADLVTDLFGDDTLLGGDGDDRLHAGPGDDALIGGLGADLIDGGEGIADAVSYLDKPAGVHVTLDAGGADDGTAGEGDAVVDVEDLSGSDHADTLIGNEGRNVIHGGRGDDALDGRGGIDRLRGGWGNDTVIGRDGFEADDVGCNDGPGDAAIADAADTVARDCEARDVLARPGDGGGGDARGGRGGGAGGGGGGGAGGGGAGGGGAGGGGGGAGRSTLARLLKLPSAKACLRGRALTVRVPGASSLKRLELRVPGRRAVALATAKRLKGGATLRGLPRRAFKLRLVAIARSGAKLKHAVTYKPCGAVRRAAGRR